MRGVQVYENTFRFCIDAAYEIHQLFASPFLKNSNEFEERRLEGAQAGNNALLLAAKILLLALDLSQGGVRCNSQCNLSMFDGWAAQKY